MRVNKLPHVGEFIDLPDAISSSGKIETKKVMWCLTRSWRRFSKLLRKGLLKITDGVDSQAQYAFMQEYVKVGRKVYLSFSIDDMLLESVFGVDFNKPDVKDLVMFKSKNRVLVYFSSF